MRWHQPKLACVSIRSTAKERDHSAIRTHARGTTPGQPNLMRPVNPSAPNRKTRRIARFLPLKDQHLPDTGRRMRQARYTCVSDSDRERERGDGEQCPHNP
jgi:hypothetical protein